LVWRYRAAPRARRIIAYGQLESAWPVVGGVLIHDDLAYFVAGRHGAADGGVHIYAARPATGEIVWHSNPKDFNTVPDVLVAREDVIHMADWQFDARTGEDQKVSSDVPLRSARLGMLNDAWYERPIALRKNLQHWQAHDTSAQMLAFDDTKIAGFQGVSSCSSNRWAKAAGAGRASIPWVRRLKAWPWQATCCWSRGAWMVLTKTLMLCAPFR
jgi:hypothetical protein